MTRGIGIDWNKSTCKWSLLEIAVYEVCVYIYIEINWVLNFFKKKVSNGDMWKIEYR